MDSFGISSSDPKTAVMQQVRQEAAVANARQLVEVIKPPCLPTFSYLRHHAHHPSKH